MDTTDTRSEVAAEVRAALGRDGRTASALADEAGISRSAMSLKLRGQRSFSVEELLTIASVLNIPAVNLIPAVTIVGSTAA